VRGGGRQSADTPSVTVTTGRIAVLLAAAALGFVAWRLLAPAEKDAQQTVQQGATTLLTQPDYARFTVAQQNLQIQLQAAGTYAGAQMPPGLTLARADAASFCIQLADGGPVSHVQGPPLGGAVPGPC
jgi:hypothetical protein